MLNDESDRSWELLNGDDGDQLTPRTTNFRRVSISEAERRHLGGRDTTRQGSRLGDVISRRRSDSNVSTSLEEATLASSCNESKADEPQRAKVQSRPSRRRRQSHSFTQSRRKSDPLLRLNKSDSALKCSFEEPMEADLAAASGGSTRSGRRHRRRSSSRNPDKQSCERITSGTRQRSRRSISSQRSNTKTSSCERSVSSIGLSSSASSASIALSLSDSYHEAIQETQAVTCSLQAHLRFHTGRSASVFQKTRVQRSPSAERLASGESDSACTEASRRKALMLRDSFRGSVQEFEDSRGGWEARRSLLSAPVGPRPGGHCGMQSSLSSLDIGIDDFGGEVSDEEDDRKLLDFSSLHGSEPAMPNEDREVDGARCSCIEEVVGPPRRRSRIRTLDESNRKQNKKSRVTSKEGKRQLPRQASDPSILTSSTPPKRSGERRRRKSSNDVVALLGKQSSNDTSNSEIKARTKSSKVASEKTRTRSPKAAPEKNRTRSPKAAPVKTRANSPKTAPEKVRTRSPKAAPVKTRANSSKTAPEDVRTNSPKAVPEKVRTYSPKAASEKPRTKSPKAMQEKSMTKSPKATTEKTRTKSPKATTENTHSKRSSLDSTLSGEKPQKTCSRRSVVACSKPPVQLDCSNAFYCLVNQQL